jgi:flagellar biosynthetic protein FlhB
MSDNEDKDSKTEDPTDKKITDALDKGDVPFSREITYVVSVLAITVLAVFYGSDFTYDMATLLRSLLANTNDFSLATGEDAMNVAGFVVKSVGLLVLPIILALMVAGLASSFTQNKPAMILTRLEPKLERISLMAGIKRLLGKHALKEFAKSLFKFTAAGTIATIITIFYFDWILSHLLMSAIHIPTAIQSIFGQAAFGLVLMISVLGVTDLIWVRQEWYEKLKMSHQEVKDERKQSEGDPKIKGQRQSIARDRSRKQMMANVMNASLVVANPTHFAIALRYHPDEGGAPMVLAKGQDILALKIRGIAEENDIPVIEDKPLARSMYKVCELDQEIPVEFYVPIAGIVRSLSDQNKLPH